MVASLPKPAGGGGGGIVAMSSVGNIQGKQESFSSASATKRAFSASSSSYACTVTPPMTLPSRGWGDRDSGSEGCGSRHFSGFSCLSTGDTGSSTGSCSSGSGGSTHNSSSSSGGSLDSGGGSLGHSARAGSGGRQLKQFNFSDGFSSAEEETWGSEGEIEETDVAGRRRALVTLGPNKHVGVGSSSRSSCSRSPPMFAEDQDGEGDEEARGLLSGSGSRPMMSSRGAVCAEGGVPGVGSRRKAAVGAGRAKRRTSLGARAGSSRPALPPAEGRGSSACTCAGGGGDGDDIEAGSSSCLSKKRPPKVSRRLFIDIENKASEPPPPRRHAPADRGRPAGRRQRGRAAAVRGLGLGPGARARRLGGGARGDADDDQGDSGDEAMCGCAERCLRLVDAWYHTLTGSTARVKFSELDQVGPSPNP